MPFFSLDLVALSRTVQADAVILFTQRFLADIRGHMLTYLPELFRAKAKCSKANNGIVYMACHIV